MKRSVRRPHKKKTQMSKPIKPIFYFWFTLYSLTLGILPIFQNKVSELVQLPPVVVISFYIALWLIVFFCGIRIYHLQTYQEHMPNENLPSVQPLTRSSFARIRNLGIAMCGTISLVGGLSWFVLGLVGTYTILPLMILIPYCILKITPITKYDLLTNCLITGTFLGVSGHLLMLHVSLLLAALRGSLYISGIPVFPLMRTIEGLLCTIAIGVFGFIVGTFITAKIKPSFTRTIA